MEGRGNFRMMAIAATEVTKSRLDKTHRPRNNFFQKIDETDNIDKSLYLAEFVVTSAVSL